MINQILWLFWHAYSVNRQGSYKINSKSTFVCKIHVELNGRTHVECYRSE